MCSTEGTCEGARLNGVISSTNLSMLDISVEAIMLDMVKEGFEAYDVVEYITTKVREQVLKVTNKRRQQMKQKW